MQNWVSAFRAGLILASAAFLIGSHARAQTNIQRIALKSGESVELGSVYWVTNCRSIVVGVPEVEVLEGPAELTLSIKEGMVNARRQNCAKPVPGGTLVATAKEIKAPMEAKLTFRVKYKTKDGDRQNSQIYNVSLFP
jgi:hypothetical protein